MYILRINLTDDITNITMHTKPTQTATAPFTLERLLEEYAAFSDAMQTEFMNKLFASRGDAGALKERPITPSAETYLWDILAVMYSYGVEGQRTGTWDLGAADLAPDSGAADASMLFLYGPPVSQPYMGDNGIPGPRLIERTVRTAIARHILDGGIRCINDPNGQPEDLLLLDEVALLANMDVRSVRNAAVASKTGPGRLITVKVGSFTFVERDAAREWLVGRPGFIRTRDVASVLSIDYANTDFHSPEQGLNFLAAMVNQKEIAPATLAKRVRVGKEDLKLWLASREPALSDDVLRALALAVDLDVDRYMTRLTIARHETAVAALRASLRK